MAAMAAEPTAMAAAALEVTEARTVNEASMSKTTVRKPRTVVASDERRPAAIRAAGPVVVGVGGRASRRTFGEADQGEGENEGGKSTHARDVGIVPMSGKTRQGLPALSQGLVVRCPAARGSAAL